MTASTLLDQLVSAIPVGLPLGWLWKYRKHAQLDRTGARTVLIIPLPSTCLASGRWGALSQTSCESRFTEAPGARASDTSKIRISGVGLVVGGNHPFALPTGLSPLSIPCLCKARKESTEGGGT